MKLRLPDITHYRTVSIKLRAWGVTVRAGGRIMNAPGETYPPEGHPADHSFAWRHGRVLGVWQVLFIAAGIGEFDRRRQDGQSLSVGAGDAILIVPGQWHRYRPNTSTGWTEYWVELEGSVLADLTVAGILPGQCVVLRAAQTEGLGKTMRALLDLLARHENGEGQGETEAELASLGLCLLGMLTAKTPGETAPLERAVRKAEQILADCLNNPPSMPRLARSLAVSYAGFRREFKRRTGLAPRQYLLRARLELAQRLIGATPLTLEAIAERVGFSSAFHLSSAFKVHFGVAPTVWRRGRNEEV